MNPAFRIDIMERGTSTICAWLFWAIIVTLFSAHDCQGQPSTAPPSSLPTMPLSPKMSAQEGPASCEFCRKLEGQPGSDLKQHHRHREPGLHPKKKANGIHRSPSRSLKSSLPRHPLEEQSELPESSVAETKQ
jgi:hypothetical protein